MLFVRDIKVRSLDVDFNQVSWKIDDTSEDVLDYTFQVLRSESSAGPWDALTEPFSDRYIFYDRFTEPFHTYRSLFYIVRVTNKLTREVQDFGPEHREAQPDLVAVELRRHMNILLKEFTGRRCWLLPVRTFGQRCSCWNATISKRTRSGCRTCFDTGFVRGYLHPIEVWAQVDPGETKREQYAQTGMTQPQNTTARVVDVGVIKPRDILIEPENVRWRVTQVNQTEQVRAPIHMEMTLHQIPSSDVEYAIPLNMDQALKDMWFAPKRNFTNPQNLGDFESDKVPRIFGLYGLYAADNKPEDK